MTSIVGDMLVHQPLAEWCGPLGDFSDDPAARSTGDFDLCLPNTEIGERGKCLDLCDDPLWMARRPRCFPRVRADLMPAVTRSLMSEDYQFGHGTTVMPGNVPSRDLG
jgi:hypothetical protein